MGQTKTKKLQRGGRDGVPTIGIVGYTNAGKTSLMNRLTDAGLRERDLYFQTLDTTLRRVRLPSGCHAVIADSIGFIQDLPHNLFAAFQATLEELTSCDVLLHVRDIAHPHRKIHKDTVLDTLRQAGVPDEKLEANMIEVWNKIDLLPSLDYVPPEAVPICAIDGTGVSDLLRVIDVVVSMQSKRQRRTVSFPEAYMQRVLTFLHQHGTVLDDTMVFSESVAEHEGPIANGYISIDAILPPGAWSRWTAEFQIEAKQSPLIQ